MKARRKKCDNATIEFATYSAKSRIFKTIELANKYKIDPRKKERHDSQLCPVCFYNKSRIGGAAMTQIQCAECEEELSFSNTNVDVMCKNCAKQYNLCKHCGGDIDAKKRRKQRF